MLTIGFTGTRQGMTEEQKTKVSEYMIEWVKKTDDLIIARQGCCVGSDEDFTVICNYISYPPIAIVGHPPTKPEYFSNKAELLSHYVKQPESYLRRNRDIVDGSDHLLATPYQYEHTLRPNRIVGTWYTINYARHRNTPIYIVYPNGRVREPA